MFMSRYEDKDILAVMEFILEAREKASDQSVKDPAVLDRPVSEEEKK